MPIARRRFAGSVAAVLLGLAGCLGGSDGPALQEVRLTIVNRTSDAVTFHFVLAGEDGLDQWREFGLDPEGRREVVVEPASERAWSGYHAVAGDEQISGTLFGQAEERSCLELEFDVEAEDIEGWMPVDQPDC